MRSWRMVATLAIGFLLLPHALMVGHPGTPLGIESAFAQPGGENLPPVAVASILEHPDDLWTNVPVHFSSEGSHDDEDGMAFAWDFGDGSGGTSGPEPVHTYTSPGPYTVVLTVVDRHGAADTDHLDLYVFYNYGDTEVIVKAIDELFTQKPFRDPWYDMFPSVAVQRGGWVAYLCILRAGQGINVTFTIPGERPADIHLFREADFQTYRDGPSDVDVTSEARGSFQNVTGEVTYRYRAGEGDRYYVVIDNRDRPPSADTWGPVNYTLIIESLPPERDDPDPPWVRTCLIVCGVGFIISLAWLYVFYGRGMDPRTPDR